MTNVPEEAGKVAVSVVDSMKSQPLLILVLVLNVIFIGAGYFALESTKARQAAEWATVLEKCLPDHEKN
jgi:CDP-diacylglycerol pyrophosphatase